MKNTLLVVDDEPQNLQLLRYILEDEYRLLYATDGLKAYEATLKHKPDLILMDVMMPNADGYESLKMIKDDESIKNIPVIFLTSMIEMEDEKQGFDLGAVDYIAKPVKAEILKRRISTHLSLVQVEELERTQQIIIQRLSRAAEYKDNETGLHVIRMSYVCKLIAEKTGLPQDYCKMILQASPMHDVGKIGVPDHILLKPGPLDAEEWKIMKQHPKIGYDIIGEHDSRLLRLAAEIAITHHEKWNGQGYPKGLKKEDIPISGRIVALADVFDALSSDRPYKKAWPVEKSIEYIREQSGEHFEPDLSDIFIDSIDEIMEIYEVWGENNDEKGDS